MSTKYQTKNPGTVQSDSTILFDRVLSGNKIDVMVSDSINKLWINYKKNKFRQETLQKKMNQYSSRIDREEDLRSGFLNNIEILSIIGMLFITVGLCIWMIDETISNGQYNIKQNEKLYRSCQSCGIRFS